MEHFVEMLISNINLGSKELTVFLLSALPVTELRGSIPVGILMFDLPPLHVYLLACFGNLVPVIPIVFFFDRIERLLEKHPFSARLINCYVEKVKNRTEKVAKFEMWGLAMFVAIPLPVTGAWTGSVAAFLLGMKSKRALIGIAAGVFIAGIIVSLLTLGGYKCYSFL